MCVRVCVRVCVTKTQREEGERQGGDINGKEREGGGVEGNMERQTGRETRDIKHSKQERAPHTHTTLLTNKFYYTCSR